MEDCIFCKIAKGDIPSHKLYEDDKTFAFLDINPISNGHTLVIPRAHGETLMDIPEEYQGAILKTASKIGGAVVKSLKPLGINYMINQGEVAGQLVKHVHMHIVPRYDGNEMQVQVAKADNSEDTMKNLKDRISSKI